MKEKLKPVEGEFRENYRQYIDLVQDEDVLTLLNSQITTLKEYIKNISEQQSLNSYGPGKWGYKEVLGHLSDTEKIMHFRALCIARGEKQGFPGFDQDQYVQSANFIDVPVSKLFDTFEINRRSLILFLETLPEDALVRKGLVDNYPLSVRAIISIIVGHFEHHINKIKVKL
jgi:hypothetical protein